MLILNNITALRSISSIPCDGLVYLEGHTLAGDGGAGYFIWRTDSIFRTSTSGKYSNDNNGTVVQVTGNDNGRFVRQFDGEINVKFFGAFGNWANATTAFEAALQFAELNSTGDHELKGTVVFIPDGNYILDSLLLRDGVSIRGESMVDTKIYPSSINAGYFVSMKSGRITFNISDLSFVGTYTGLGGNSLKDVFYLEATPASGSGGLWFSTIKNIRISYFDGLGIYLKGSTTDRALLNQFNVFENIRVEKGNSNIEKYQLLIDGLNGQNTFINCQFDGGPAGTQTVGIGPNVIIRGYGTSPQNAFQPSTITFLNCTFQNGDTGVRLEKTTNITIDNCWFEMLKISVAIDGTGVPCKSISVVNSLFSNASGFGPYDIPGHPKANGACIQVKAAYVNIVGNFIITGNDSATEDSCLFVYAFPDSLGVKLSANSFTSARIGRTFGILAQIAAGASTNINCQQHSIILLSGTGAINFLDSNLNAGETLVIKANGVLTFTKATASVGNVVFPSSGSTLQLQNGEIANFVKLDVGLGAQNNSFQLVSVIRNNP